jgi:hypothetical protein
MVFKELRCLLMGKSGMRCNKHLADVEACAPATIRFTCGGKHEGYTDKVEFSQDSRGVITWRPVPMEEQKRYEDDGVRIGMSGD